MHKLYKEWWADCIFNPPNNLHILILTIIFTSHSAFSSFFPSFCTDYNRSSSSSPFHPLPLRSPAP